MPRASIKTPSILATLLLLGLAFSLVSREPQADPRRSIRSAAPE